MTFTDDDQAPKERSVLRFTDQDLKRLKERIKYLNGCHWINLDLRRDGANMNQEGDWIKQIWYLLARLEAAEVVIWECFENHNFPSDGGHSAYMEWKKSCGKAGE